MSGLAGQAFTILFARGFTRVAQLLAFLILARFLTPAEFGWYGIVTTAVSLAALLGSLGLRQSVAYRIGRKEMTVGEGTATVLAVWPVLVAVSAGVVIWLYAGTVPSISSIEAGAAIALGVAGAMLVMLVQGIFLGRGEVRRFSSTETLPRVMLAVFAALLALFGMVTLANALWAFALGFAATIPLALWLALNDSGPLRPRLGALPGMLGYGLAFAFNLFLITLCSRLSMFVIEQVHGAAAAGQFFAAVRVNEIFLEAATAFGLVLFSDSARATDVTIPGRNARIACWMFWGFSLVALGIAVVAPVLLRLFIGADYADAGLALQLLAISLGPAAATKVIYPTIAGQGRPLFGTPAIIVSLAANLGLAIALVPMLGIAGGALALVAGQYLLYLGYALSCRRLFHIPLRDFILPRGQDVQMIVRGVGRRMKLLTRRVRGSS